MHNSAQVVPSDGTSKPSTEIALVKALAETILGAAATKDVVKQVLIERGQVNDAPALLKDSELLTDEMAAALFSDGEDSDDDVRRQYRELRAQREAHDMKQKQRIAALSAPAATASGATGSAVASSAAQGEARRRTFVPVVATGLSREAAAEYLPAGFSLSKDGRENRWRLRGQLLKGEKSKSFGPNSATDDWAAMLFVLQIAWRAYTRHSGVECPYDFQVV